MKTQQSTKVLSVVVAASVVLAGCSGLGKMVKKAPEVTYTVSPNPLEMHGDSVIVNVSGKYPPKMFAKKAVLTINPTITYNGGEKSLKPVTLLGEKAEGTGQKIANATGGSFSYTDKVAYTPEMKVSELKLKAVASVGSKQKDFPFVKIADGVITTPMLLKNDDKAIIGKDNFMKVVPVSDTANIFYVINQSVVRPSELKSDDIKAMRDFIEQGNKKGNVLKNINISAYASPDGELTRNANLAEDRAKSARKAVQDIFGKLKIDAGKDEAFYNIVTTAEDWEGFKRLMEQSNIADKELILRVLTMYTDLEVREKEIKNLSKTYVEVADKILPKLRRAVITVNAEEKSRTDEQITALSTSTPDSLSNEEILYAGTLTQDMNTQAAIYKAAEKQYPNDWRSANNLGMVYLMQNKLADAQAQFEKADKLSPNNPIVQNNLGIVARWKGDRKAAMTYYSGATAAGSQVNYNMGIIQTLNGDYASAVSSFGSEKSLNAALAQMLNGSPDAALATLDASPDKDTAAGHYLRAIIGARTGKTDLMINSLKTAISKDASYKQMAKEDAEFIKYRANADFAAIVQ